DGVEASPCCLGALRAVLDMANFRIASLPSDGLAGRCQPLLGSWHEDSMDSNGSVEPLGPFVSFVSSADFRHRFGRVLRQSMRRSLGEASARSRLGNVQPVAA